MKRRESLFARSVGLAVALTAILLMAISVQAAGITTLADWTFEVSQPNSAGPYLAETGALQAASLASGSHAAGATTYSSPSGAGTPHSYSADNWQVGDYWQFQTSSLGYQSLTFGWRQTSSNTGPRDFGLFWSTDGTIFTQFGADYVVLPNAAPNPLWSPTMTSAEADTYRYFDDLSAIGALDNQPIIYFRLVDQSPTSANGLTVQTGGTDRIDPLFEGVAIPEPASVVLAGIGLLGLAGYAWQRRRRREAD